MSFGKKLRKAAKKGLKGARHIVQGVGHIGVGGGATAGSRAQPYGGNTYEVGYRTPI